MTGRIRRHRQNPMKVLVILLYARHTWITNQGGGRVKVSLAPLSRLLRVPSSRLREYLEWLEQLGYLEELRIARTTATVTIRRPTLWDLDD